MVQKCPQCGEWCHAETQSFKDKAIDSGVKSYQQSAQIGGTIGKVFGKRGENIGRKLSTLSNSSSVLTQSLLGALSDSDYHFVCPKCGYKWEANKNEDQLTEYQSDTDELVYKISQLVQSIETEEDYEQINEYCKILDSRDYAEALFWRAKAQYELANVFWNLWGSCSNENDENGCRGAEYKSKRSMWFNKANKTINDSIYYYNADLEYYQDKAACAYNLKAWIEFDIGFGDVEGLTSARNSFIYAMNTDFPEVREAAIKGYNKITDALLSKFNHFLTVEDEVSDFINDEDEEKRDIAKEIIDSAEKSKFCNLPYTKRKFIFITKEGANNIAGCTDPDDIIRYVFTLDVYPSGISFPVGHPQPNTLYVANPAKKGMYIPYKDAEYKLFHDRVNDFIRLSQCLGATEISFHSIQGESISQSFLSSTNVNGGVSVKGNTFTGDYGVRSKEESSYDFSKEVERTFIYDPINKPYCPNDVEWLHLDDEWQKFVKQRLEGNILESSVCISSSESIKLNTNTIRDVKAAYENMMVKCDANYKSEEDNTFSSSESSVWQIFVKFRSMRDFVEQNNSQSKQFSSVKLSPVEEKYKDDFLFVLEGGIIGDAERSFLERKRQKFGISEEKAKMIEESCTLSLSKEEREYIDIYKDLLVDGKISEKCRKLLNREAESLGLSEAQKVKVESLCKC